MAIEFTCPACGATLRVRDGVIGQVVRCSWCLTMLRVPQAEPTPSPPSPPPFPGAEPESEAEARRTSRPQPPPPTAPAANPLPVATATNTPPEPPEQPQARGARFWLLVTSSIFVVGAFACCGLAAVLMSDPDWQEYESDEGGFRVELPAEPSDEMAKPRAGSARPHG